MYTNQTVCLVTHWHSASSALEQSGGAPAIHLVCDVPSVKHLPKHVAQIIPRHSLRGLQVVEQHIPAGPQVSGVEGVRPAEAHARARARPDARPKLLASQQEGVIEAEAKEDAFVVQLLCVGAGPAMQSNLFVRPDETRGF